MYISLSKKFLANATRRWLEWGKGREGLVAVMVGEVACGATHTMYATLKCHDDDDDCARLKREREGTIKINSKRNFYCRKDTNGE